MASEITEFLKNIQRKKFRPFFILGDRKKKGFRVINVVFKEENFFK
jgi:hypothetical protein